MREESLSNWKRMDENVTVAPEISNTQVASDSFVSKETVFITFLPSSGATVYVPAVNDVLFTSLVCVPSRRITSSAFESTASAF